MNQPTCPVFRLWLPIIIGLVAVCGLLLTVHPTAVASPPAEQPGTAVVLWLVLPETPPASGPWPLDVEAYQAGWRARSEVVEERLAALKAQGRLIAFEPLPGAVGFTVTAPAGLPPEVSRWPGVARVTSPDEATPESLAAWWRQGLDVAGAARSAPLSSQQVTTLTLNLGLHSRLVSGSVPRPEPIVLSLTRDGELIASNTATPFPDGGGGYLYAATLYGTCYGCGGGGYCHPVIEPGDVLQSVQAGQTLSLTVPLLTALADQDTASVYGQAPLSTTLQVYFYRYDDPSVAYQQAVTATATGDYQADFGSLTPVAPRDYGYVFYASENGNEAGNHVYTRYNVPFLRVRIDGDYVDGVVAPCTTVTATLHDDTGALRDPYPSHSSSSSDGAFSVDFYTLPQVGDTLVVTAAGQVMSMIIPALIARPDPTSDAISGEAPPGAVVQVELYRGPLEHGYTSCPPYDDPDYSLSVTATLTGTLAGAYAADFSSLAGVIAGDYGVVYLTDAAGYQAYRCFAVPFLQAHLGDYCLAGQVNGGAQVTVTVWGSSGVPRDVRSVYICDNGYFHDYDRGDGLRLLVGDRVTVTAQDGQETGLTAPLLTAYADLANSLVHGQSPPGSPLRVGLSCVGGYLAGGGPPYYPSYEYTLWVTSTASGVYTADFSSLATFQPGYQGAVFYINPEGHEVFLEFVVPIVRVQSGSNYVAGVLPIESEQVVVTLRDALGQVKATATAWSYYEGSFDVYLNRQDGQRAIIEAGDTVKVAAGDTLVTVAVPTLTVQTDYAADLVSGQSPPDAPLKITWYDGDNWGSSRTWMVTSTVAGGYSLGLSGQVDLERGDRIEVTWADENGNEVWVACCVPRLEATLGSHQVSVFGPVYSPLTLTLLGISGELLYTGTTTLDESGSAEVYLYDASFDALYLEAGQTLVADLADEVITVTLPHLTAQADPQADTVSGEAPAGARLMVFAYGKYYWQSYWPVTATVTGTYSVDFGGAVDIGSGSSGKVVYLHPDGHRVTLDYAVPHIEVTLGEPYVNGVAPGLGVVTVTLHDEGGSLKGNGVDTAQYSGAFYVYLTDAQQEPVPVAGGDVVIVEAMGHVVSFTVPALTVSFDRQTGILTGTAPAMTWLQVTLAGGSRQAQADAGGTYAMDWSDLSSYLGEQGYVYHTDDLGNRATLHFAVSYYTVYLPLVSRDT